MFEKVTPESVGVSSGEILRLLKMLDDYRLHNHSIMMFRGNKLFAEVHYKPFDNNFLHRMYSVSKSFVAISVGMAITEGLMSLDDVIVDYFPEFQSNNIDDMYRRCTVRDMLCMRSNISDNVYWWGKFESRVEAYYTQKTTKVPGTVYCYDSIGSFLLGCIVKKVSGKDFLEYLKEKVLLDMGFSKESYVLNEPGGYGVGDSGVMCTAKDLAIFARLIMQKGFYNGKQYIDRQFMEDAIKNQVPNDFDGTFLSYQKRGYGYLIWQTLDGTYSLVGAGDQYAICHPEKDFLFVITSDNQANTEGKHILHHEVCKHFIPKISDTPLPQNEADEKALAEYINTRTLITQYGEMTSPYADNVNGTKYIADRENNANVSDFCLNLDADKGSLNFTMNGEKYTIEFGLGKNLFYDFSFGTRPVLDMMGKNEDGTFKCAASGAWLSEDTFAISLQVIDTYFGGLNIRVSCKDEYATLLIKKYGQYVFDGVGGYAIGKK